MNPFIDFGNAALALLVAPVCAACGEALDRPVEGPVCDACWSSIRPLAEPLCDVCGDSLPSWRLVSAASRRCVRCRRLPRVITQARAVGAYDGRLRDILHALKYGGRRTLARRLAGRMRDSGADLLARADFVVPVPLHFRRRYRRGFNQAAELAKHLGTPCLHALRRLRATATQTDLPEAQRHRNVRGAFAIRARAVARLRDRTVVIVDDVSTTGATLDACARELLAAGAREVRALTAARAESRLR